MTRTAKMLTGLLALVWSRNRRHPVATCRDEVARDSDSQEEAGAALGGCYHDGLAYSLGYDACGVVELSGETFTNLNSGLDGGAEAALRRHRQNYDPNCDVERFIVALKPVKVIRGRRDGESYGLPPGPLAGGVLIDKMWGGHVAEGRFDVVRRAMERIRRDCERHGVDLSKSQVTISVDENPHRTKLPDIPSCSYCVSKMVGARYQVEETFSAKNACIEHARQAKASGKIVNVHPAALEFADPVAEL